MTANGIEVYYGGNIGKKIADLQLKANLNCIAVHGKTVAVGGEVSLSPRFEISSLCLSHLRITKHGPQDKKLYLYSWDGTSLKEVASFDKNRNAITAMVFSPDGKWLAAGESSGKIVIFSDEGSGLQVGR